MIRAMYPEDVFIPWQRQVKVKVEVRTEGYKANILALLDSGATDNFIAPAIVNAFQIPTHNLSTPKVIRNVDGTQNSIGKVTQSVLLQVRYKDIETLQSFFVIDLGMDSMLLGYPFLATNNPQVNWSKGTLQGCVAAYLQPRETISIAHDASFTPWYDRGAIGHPRTFGRATKATELAIQAKNKEEKSWQEIVPKEYHRYGKVFSSEAAMRFPEPRPWDHEIELLPDAPLTLDCKVYPLSYGEQIALEEFLEEHLNKGYIR